MEKETMFVAMSNQKGGVGKSAFTILFASFLTAIIIDKRFQKEVGDNMRAFFISFIFFA